MQKLGKSKRHDTFKLVVLSLALLAIAFLGVVNPIREQKTLGAIAAKVDGEEIMKDEFVRRYQREVDSYKQYHGSEFNPAAFGLAQKVLEKIIDELAWLQIAKNNGALASVEEISSQIIKIPSFQDENGNFSVDLMDKILRSNRLTEKSLAKDFRIQLSTQKLRNQIVNQIFVSSKEVALIHKLKESKYKLSYLKLDPTKLEVSLDEKAVEAYKNSPSGKKEIEAHYKTHLSDYKSEKEVKVSQVLVSYKGSERSSEAITRTKEEAKALAEKLLIEARKASSSDQFATLAKSKSDDVYSKSHGGDLGFLSFGEMPEAFSKAVFKLKKGETSKLIETPFGFHIARVEAVDEAKDISLEEATSEITTKILSVREQKKKSVTLAQALLGKLKKGESVDGLMKEHNLKWETSSEVNLLAQSIPGLPKEFIEIGLGLKNKGDLHPKVLKKQKANYLVKLEAIKRADLSDLDDDKKDLIKRTIEQKQAYELLGQYSKEITEEYKNPDLHTIYINEEYKALDKDQAS